MINYNVFRIIICKTFQGRWYISLRPLCKMGNTGKKILNIFNLIMFRLLMLFEKQPIRRIESAALHAVSSARVDELARPRLREEPSKFQIGPNRPVDIERLTNLAVPRARSLRCKFQEQMNRLVRND